MRAEDASPNPVDIHVGLVIRQRRKALSISQQALAECVGITFQQIQKYERGANRVSASMLHRIANALRCEPGAFFMGLPSNGDSRATNDPEGFGHTGREFLAAEGGLELARAYLAMRPDYRRAVLAAARAFSQGSLRAPPAG